MASGPYARGNGHQIKWREDGVWQTELFADEFAAKKFKIDVERAGNHWPEGWAKGRGFVTPEELEAERQAALATNCTPFVKFAQRRTESLRAARDIGADSHRKYLSYAEAFVKAVPVAVALTDLLEEDDTLRALMLEDPTNAAAILPGIEETTPVNPDLCIEDVDRDVIAAWVTYMRVAGKSTKTIRNYHGFLHGVFGEAYDSDIIGRNPCARTKLGVNVKTRQKVVLEREEFALIASCIKPDSRDLALTAVGTGARFGEITAWTVGDWMAGERALVVNKAWKRAMSGHAVGKPKTDAGVRLVYVGASVAEIIERRIKGLESTDLIFTAPRGGRVRQNVFGSDRWQPAVKAAQEQGLTKSPVFHDLRHTHISWLRDSGLPDTAIKDLVGHSDESMTGKYGSVSRHTIDAATAGIDSALPRRAS